MKFLVYLVALIAAGHVALQAGDAGPTMALSASFERLEIDYIPLTVDMNRSQTIQDVCRNRFYCVVVYSPYREEVITELKSAISAEKPIDTSVEVDARWVLRFVKSDTAAGVTFGVSRDLDYIYYNGCTMTCSSRFKDLLLQLTGALK